MKNYEKSNSQLRQSKIENHIWAKGFSLLSTGSFIITSKSYRCEKSNISANYNALSADRFSSKTKFGKKTHVSHFM